MDEWRVLLVGYGVMGRMHRQTLQSRAGMRVVGIVRQTPESGEDGLPIYTSLAKALRDLAPGIALISTPHHCHFEQARMCLEHDCHVLVEKPLTLCYAEAEELVRLADARKRWLIVGLQRRYEGFCEAFRELRAAGSLGTIYLVTGLFAHRFALGMLQGWRLAPDQAGAGIVDDSALHLLDLLVYCAGGRVQEVEARVLEGAGLSVPHSFVCQFQTDQGVTVSGCGSYLAPENSVQEEISIFGSNGSLFMRRFCLEWNTKPPGVYYKSADGKVARTIELSPVANAKALPLLALIDVLQGRGDRRALYTEARQTLGTHWLVEQLRHARRSGKGQPIAPMDLERGGSDSGH